MAISNLSMESKLNPRIWGEDNVLLPEIRQKLLQISKEFLDDIVGPIKIKHVILTGSLCSYQWRAESDWDLHIIAEPKEDSYKDTVLDYFATKSKEFNERHNITLKGYPVEVNLKDIETEYENKAIYDLVKNEWLVEPREPTNTLDDPEVLKIAHEFQNRIDDMIVRKAPLEDFKVIRDEIKLLRTNGLKEGGEYSIGNLAFKTLRYSGHLQKISDYRLNLFDKELSLEDFKKFYATEISF
jgi:hypothetical protein